MIDERETLKTKKRKKNKDRKKQRVTKAIIKW